MRSGTAILAGIAASICAGSVAAADNPYGGGTRLTGPKAAEIPTGPMSSQDRARTVMLRFAGCMVKSRRTSVINAIAPEPWQDNSNKRMADLIDSNCLEDGELRMPSNLLRGALFQQLYRERFSSGPPAPPAAPIDFAAGQHGALTDEAKAETALRQFGDCVVRRDPADSHELVMAAPGGSREAEAIRALAPHFSPCVIQGAKWTMNRASVTAVVSEVLYRNAMAAKP